jgi:hypothetical protein
MIDDFEHAVDKLLPLAIVQVPQCQPAAEVRIFIRITSGASEGHSRVISMDSDGRSPLRIFLHAWRISTVLTTIPS